MTMTMTMTIKKTNKHELSLSIVAIAISAMMLCAPPAFLGATAGGGILLAQAFTTAPTATAPPAIIFGSRFSAAGVVVAPYSRQHQHNMVAVDLTEKEDKKQDSTAKNPSQAFGSPLSEGSKEFTASTVSMLKSLVFDNLFIGKERDYARFYALETIARMPYFSYLSVLHFYETIGRWRKANYLKLHFAESWNELHHLLIMEELGGSELWRDRFVAQHIAVAYFWMVFGMYLFNPTLAYNLNQHVEEHAYATYDKYAKDNEEYLKQQPAPQIAIEYYTNPNNVYMFDEFQSHNFGDCHPPRRRPVINNLYDVFMAVRDDELEHVKTMTALQQDVSMSSLNEEDEGCDVPPELLNII